MNIGQTGVTLNSYTDEGLAGCDSAALLELMIENEDRVPRNVIDECARHGDGMVELLGGLLRDDQNWNGKTPLGEWWLLLHAIMIMGLIPSERAGLMLVGFMRRMSLAKDDNLQDWLAGYWPALFRNKPDTVMSALRDLSEDRSFDWYIRICAMEAHAAGAQHRSETALEHALDWAAGMAADEVEDWDLRLIIGNMLLDFPRARYRPLLDDLASRQPGWGMHFSAHNVAQAYIEGKDQPGWNRFNDPWEFYSPGAIENRRQRWEREDHEYHEREMVKDGLGWDDGYASMPYTRDAPKIGRNDPCPCGSGKKYKKCCLQ